MKSFMTLAVLLAIPIAGNGAVENADPLDQIVPDVGWKYASFEEAVREIETKTGFKVSCPPALREFMQTLWLNRGRGVSPLTPRGNLADSKLTTRKYLNDICQELALAWKFNSDSRVIELEVAWKAVDPRPTAELLQFIWKPGYSTDFEKDRRWQDAFNALLSRPENYNQAWKVRQKSILQGLTRSPDVRPVWVKPIISSSGERFILVLLCEPIQMYPGSGSVSYYWFKESGTLMGAELMSTGHRCALVDAAIDDEMNQNSDRPSELHLILKRNLRDFLIARLELQPDGFKLKHLTDAAGKPMENTGVNIGMSLMAPPQE